MTSGPNELKASLQRLIDGNASEGDRDAVQWTTETYLFVNLNAEVPCVFLCDATLYKTLFGQGRLRY